MGQGPRAEPLPFRDGVARCSSHPSVSWRRLSTLQVDAKSNEVPPTFRSDGG